MIKKSLAIILFCISILICSVLTVFLTGNICMATNEDNQIELVIIAPSQIIEMDNFQIMVCSNLGYSIIGATVNISGIGTSITGMNGIATFNAPLVDTDTTYTINATFIGYTDASKTIVVKDIGINNEEDSKSLFIKVSSSEVEDGESFEVTVVSNNVTVADATVDCFGEKYQTDSNGKATLTALPTNGSVDSYFITATKMGYEDASPFNIKISSDDKIGTPGFKLILVVCAIALALFWKRKRI